MHDLGPEDAAGWLQTEGALLDGLVQDATVGDCQAVVDLIRSQGWWYDYAEDSRSCRLPARAQDIFAHAADRAATLHVRPVPGVLVNFYFWGADTIDFDCDPKQLQSQHELDALARLVRALGRQLGKPVILGLEGCLPDRPAATYDPTCDRLLATR
jgi:hypothetical protein